MYVMYETYTDETSNMRDLRFNTKILGVYQDKKIGLNELTKYVENIQTLFTEENDWYVKKYDKKILENDKIVDIYEVFNDFIGNYEEVFYVILEKVGDDLNEK